MSIVAAPIVQHPLAMHFIGRAERQVYDADLTEKGFIAHLSSIVTSKGETGETKYTPVNLVSPRTTEDNIKPGDLYNINCKLIGSNTQRTDQLHFVSGAKLRIDGHSESNVPAHPPFVNKVGLIGLGIITKKEVMRDQRDGSISKVMLMLKSVDRDPTDGSAAVWLTKNYVLPSMFGLGFANKYNEGDEVQVSGMVVDYDKDENMWVTELYGLVHCGMNSPERFKAMEAGIVQHRDTCCAASFHKHRLIAQDRYKVRRRGRPLDPSRSYARYLLWKSSQLEKYKQRYPGGRRSSIA